MSNEHDRRLQAAESHDIVRVVNLMLTQAFKDRARRIEVEPHDGRGLVRYHLESRTVDVMQPPADKLEPILDRLKLLGNLDVCDSSRVQQGSAELIHDGRPRRVRISTRPGTVAESVLVEIEA